MIRWPEGTKLKGISIHALREEGDLNFKWELLDRQEISIHALREEGDLLFRTRSRKDNPISIHALREEGDCRLPRSCRFRGDFYPRPPRGGRQTPLLLDAGIPIFLSTPSARRATQI